MKLRREYSLKLIARRFNCSVKTLYRVYQRQHKQRMSDSGTPPTETRGA
ncbi:MAG: hypothetical protein KAY59_11385 [Acidobacteria bacterium]|nr:hypothetical protein [Acidobacteriota bacterium]